MWIPNIEAHKIILWSLIKKKKKDAACAVYNLFFMTLFMPSLVFMYEEPLKSWIQQNVFIFLSSYILKFQNGTSVVVLYCYFFIMHVGAYVHLK